MDWQGALYFWEWAHSPLGAFHLYAAIVAMMSGPLVFWRKKGDIAHRLIGFVYLIAMFTTNLSALAHYDFTGSINFFHIAAVFSLLTITAGLVAIIVYGQAKSKIALDMHLQFMSWSYYGLILAAIAESGVRAVPKLINNMSDFWMIFTVLMVVCGVIGAVITARLVTPVRKRWLRAS